MVAPFARMLAFDAWIGNSDRHQENWGVLRRVSNARLAPMFDPAACLGVELDEAKGLPHAEADVGRYMAHCPSGFGDGVRERPLMMQDQVVAELEARWPEWNAGISGWVEAFGSAVDTLEQVVARVPSGWLPPRRAAFACRLLRTRLQWLRERATR